MRHGFRALVALTLSVLAAGRAEAQRASTLDMSCGEARATVTRSRGIVLGTGGATYDRFVRDRGSCEVTEITVPAFVPARDTPECFIGYRCKEPSRDDRFGGFW